MCTGPQRLEEEVSDDMTHERYPIENRRRLPFQNPEWHQFSGKQYRYPNQFGEALLVEGANCLPEHVDALVMRGEIFPMETAEPMPATLGPLAPALESTGE